MSRIAKRRFDDERIIKKRLKIPANKRFAKANPDEISRLRDTARIYKRCRCSWCMGKYIYKNLKGPQIKDYGL